MGTPTIKVGRRAKNVGYLIILGVLTVPFLGALHIQELPSASIGIDGRLFEPIDTQVEVEVRRSGSYGLSPLEQKNGWPALNDAFSTRATLGSSPFRIELPQASYCVQRFLWEETPPPPIHFVLRFSDAPGEEYVVRDRDGRADYIVRTPEGTLVPNENASWALRFGDFWTDSPHPHRALWLLDVTFERRHQEETPEAGRSHVARS